MSCNGCRVLRKGCSEACMLRSCFRWIDGAEAQGHATVFVAKFFGRAGLMSFVSAVPSPDRAAVFQSLLYEACGRTVNPVGGAVGLLMSGNWQLCQAAVEGVLRGGARRPISDHGWEAPVSIFSSAKRRRSVASGEGSCDLDLGLRTTAPGKKRRRPGTPSMNSEESVTTSLESRVGGEGEEEEPRLLKLFV